MVRIVALLAVLVVASCGTTPPNDAPCLVDTYTRHDNDVRPVRIVAGNNGRWCSFTWQIENGVTPEPARGGQILLEPEEGTARVMTVNGTTRVEYRSVAGFVGTDSFKVEIGGRKQVLNVVVDVRNSPGMVAATGSAPSPAYPPAGHDPAERGGQPPPAPASNPPDVQPLTQR
jgi:hypothetical protein